MYNEKLRMFFKSKGYSQKEAAQKLGVSQSSFGKYLNGTDNFKPEFLSTLLREFPSIDLKYIFSKEDENNSDASSELKTNYGFREKDVLVELEIIEDKLAKIRKYLTHVSEKEEVN